MEETRRRFLATFGAAASCFVTARGYAQEPKKKDSPAPDPPQPAETLNPAEVAAMKADPRSVKRAALLQNEREFRAGVDRLYQLVGELKEDVAKTGTTDVFSVQMYKRTKEIEKLAKQLEGKARG